MPPLYAVHTKYTASDRQVLQSYERMGKASRKFERRTSTAFRNASKEGYRFGTIVKGVLAANVIYGGMNLISRGIGGVTSNFMKFEDSMVGAVARFDDLGPNIDDFGGKVSDLSQKVRNAVRDTRYSFADGAQAMVELSKANFDSAASLGILPSMLNMSTAAQEDLGEATQMSSDLLGAFSLRSKDVQEQLRNHTRLNDQLTKVGLMGTGGLRDMFETLKHVAPLAKELNMTQERVMALGVALDNAGIKGTNAATALKRGWLNIYTKMRPELEANGVNIADPETGKLRDYVDILSDMHAKLKVLRQEERVSILSRIFSMHGLAGNIKLFNELGKVREFTKELGNVDGTSKLVADAQNMSAIGKLLILGNALTEKSFQVFETFLGKGKNGIKALTEAIREWDPSRLIEGLRATWFGLSRLWQIIQPFLPMLPYLIAYFVSFNVALKGLQLLQSIMLFGRLFKAMVAAKGAMVALNLLVAANPIGLLATGIAVAVVALIALEKKFGLVSDAWNYWTDKVKGFVDWFVKTPFWKVLSGIGEGMVGAGKALINMESPEMKFPPPPNVKEAQARRSGFLGQLNIAGAPEGSTVESKTTGAPPLRIDMLGVAP